MNWRNVVWGIIPAGLMLGGCTDGRWGDEAERSGNTRIVATIDNGDEDGAKARTCIDPNKYAGGVVGLLWTPGDALGVFGSDGTANARFTTTQRSGQASFDGTLKGGETPVAAYYPYSADNAGRSADNLTGEVHAVQTYNMATGALTDDWKVGQLKGSSASGHEFTMTHLFSMIRTDISATGTDMEGQRLEYITLEVIDGANAARTPRINGRFTFSANDATYSMEGAAAEGSDCIRMTWPDRPELAANASYTGYMTVIPDINEGDKLAITVGTAEYAVTYEVRCRVTFEPGKIYTFPMSMEYLARKMKEDYGTEPRRRTLPKMTALEFTVAANPGKILDKQLTTQIKSGSFLSTPTDKYVQKFNAVTTEKATINGNAIELTVPYLYDFNLVPTFTVGDGAVVTANGQKLVSGETRVNWAEVRQLEVTAGEDTRTYDVNVHNSGLPVVVIEQSTSGDFKNVTSGSSTSKVTANLFVDLKLRGKDTEWVEDDKLTVYNADGSVDVATADCGIRLRGNTTQKLPKKPLAVKFVKKQAVLGMSAHKRWCLLANWLDKSMIRNILGFTAANATVAAWQQSGLEPGLVWNPHGRNVELVINGRHVGNYLLCEQIKINKNRLNINDNFADRKKDGLTTGVDDCGYLIECDNNYDEAYKDRTGRGIPFMLKDDAGTLPEGYFNTLTAKFREIEKLVNEGNFEEYSKLLDLPSVIDQWVIWELALNREYTEPRSVYMYMNGAADHLHAGPVWDFDRGTFQNPDLAKANGNKDRIKPWDKFLSSTLSPSMWYPILMTHPQYVAELKKRWAVLYPALQSVVGEIYRLGEENRLSWQYNSQMWPGTSSALQAGYPSGFTDFSGDENLGTYEEVIDNLASCYMGRLSAMDALINAL